MASPVSTSQLYKSLSTCWLVVYRPSENMSSSVGMIIPNIWKVIKVMFQTTNQHVLMAILWYLHKTNPTPLPIFCFSHSVWPSIRRLQMLHAGLDIFADILLPRKGGNPALRCDRNMNFRRRRWRFSINGAPTFLVCNEKSW